MKSKYVFALLSMVLAATFSFAQGGFQRRTVEERVKMVMDKLADFKMDKDKSAKVEKVFTDYYTSMDKMRDEMRSSGGTPDRQAMRSKFMKMTQDRDDELKKLFSDDEYKKWKDEIEPSMRPQRGQGRRGGQ